MSPGDTGHQSGNPLSGKGMAREAGGAPRGGGVGGRAGKASERASMAD